MEPSAIKEGRESISIDLSPPPEKSLLKIKFKEILPQHFIDLKNKKYSYIKLEFGEMKLSIDQDWNLSIDKEFHKKDPSDKKMLSDRQLLKKFNNIDLTDEDEKVWTEKHLKELEENTKEALLLALWNFEQLGTSNFSKRGLDIYRSCIIKHKKIKEKIWRTFLRYNGTQFLPELGNEFKLSPGKWTCYTGHRSVTFKVPNTSAIPAKIST